MTYWDPSKGESDMHGSKWNGSPQEVDASKWHNLPHKPTVKSGSKPSPGSSADAQPVELVPVAFSNRTNIPALEPNSGSKPPTNNFGDYEQTMLEQHNVHRRNHSASDLAWDNTLAQYAENIANSCVFQHDIKQGSGGYGQNLAYAGSSGGIDGIKVKTAASAVTMQWYNGEMANWQFYGQDKPPSSSSLGKWGHFTQVVWKDTTKVGCATVKCAAGTVSSFDSWYTVCNYNPQGNFGDQYGSNVLKPVGEKMVTV
ncbi:cysteine-rich secretory protein family domain-containing protein [Hirsutella rhossiliensis]|uniref:Cysteine-rich secretory protein family domain-containing protein n=1 Tax=Hirsutella rhossiliensis TaxID=111463 RepID=A0A9P8SE61_9HYPO|nr:cysteine-rich secretory protein family domain-containing protein [Hirsutella rhossiliensis]KAH0957711.1 cysteine-rich secretory protein family domain-containing protein [Hirsutella rhossiliensis]